MKKYVRDFLFWGSMFAWVGPVITAIIWLILHYNGVVSTLSVNEVVLAIITATIYSFIAGGVVILYEIEKLPKQIAGLIHISVLYIDYLGFYLLNGWIKIENIWIFTLIFVAIFITIWLSIYIPTKIKFNKINQKLSEEKREEN